MSANDKIATAFANLGTTSIQTNRSYTLTQLLTLMGVDKSAQKVNKLLIEAGMLMRVHNKIMPTVRGQHFASCAFSANMHIKFNYKAVPVISTLLEMAKG